MKSKHRKYKSKHLVVDTENINIKTERKLWEFILDTFNNNNFRQKLYNFNLWLIIINIVAFWATESRKTMKWNIEKKIMFMIFVKKPIRNPGLFPYFWGWSHIDSVGVFKTDQRRVQTSFHMVDQCLTLGQANSVRPTCVDSLYYLPSFIVDSLYYHSEYYSRLGHDKEICLTSFLMVWVRFLSNNKQNLNQFQFSNLSTFSSSTVRRWVCAATLESILVHSVLPRHLVD